MMTLWKTKRKKTELLTPLPQKAKGVVCVQSTVEPAERAQFAPPNVTLPVMIKHWDNFNYDLYTAFANWKNENI